MPARILFLEPDDDVRDMYHTYFARLGFDTYGAENASQCIDHIRKHQPHAVILEPEHLSENDLIAIGGAVSRQGARSIVVSRKQDHPCLPTTLRLLGCCVKPISMRHIEALVLDAFEIGEVAVSVAI